MKAFAAICFACFLISVVSCGRDVAGPEPVITKAIPEIKIGSTINEVRQVYGTPDLEGYDYHDLGQFDDNGIIRFDYAMHYDAQNLTFWLDKSWPRLVTHIDGSL
ncbi:MAG: hypothetical protein ACRBF0_03585 [Calditrichia bacterium]